MKAQAHFAVIINRIRHKIEENPKEPQYLHTIRGMGYKFIQWINNQYFHNFSKFLISIVLVIISF